MLVDRNQVDEVLQTIYNENPGFWPHGLSRGQFKSAGDELHVILDEETSKIAGFVGWQPRDTDKGRIGYYSIGVLPEFRGCKIATTAVKELMQKKAGEVDEVGALIMDGNRPSKALARALGVEPTLVKNASRATTARNILMPLLSGLGTAAASDQAIDPHGRTAESLLRPQDWDKERGLMFGLNTLLGGLGGNLLNKGEFGKGLTAITLAPTKDLAFKGVGTLTRADKALEGATKKLTEAGAAAPMSLSLPDNLVPAAVGLGATGVGAAALIAYLKHKAEERRAISSASGRIRVTLPTKNPNDVETSLDLPIEAVAMSNSLRGNVYRDARRRLYEETSGRTKKRKPRDPANPTSREQEIEELYSEIDQDKAAAMKPPLVPSPPQQGYNVAQPQAMQADPSSTASTEANPQIMAAQQQAQAAEAQVQQQAAQSQQQQDAAVSEMQNQMNEERMKNEHDKQILQMSLEKEKMTRELMETEQKVKAKTSGAAGGMLKNRMSRLTKNLRKRATADELQPPQAPIPEAPTGKLRPNAAQTFNQHGATRAVAEGRMVGDNNYLVSYGKPLDWARQNLWAPWLQRVSAAKSQRSIIPAGLSVTTPNSFQALLSSANLQP